MRSDCVTSRKSSVRLRRAAVLAAGLATVAGCALGCGSSGSPRSNTTTAPVAITKAAFVAKANSICAQADPALAAAQGQLARKPSRSQVASLVRSTYVPSIEAQMAQIGALGTPAGDQATVSRMLTAVKADLQKIKRDPMLVATNVFGDFARIAHPYGLTACAPLS
jgi:hypothetical protein